MPRGILRGGAWPAPGEPLFTPEDYALAIALEELEREEAEAKCPLCGMPRTVCRDPDNQFRFEADGERCHATHALLTAQKKDSGDDISDQATAWSARLKTPTQPT